MRVKVLHATPQELELLDFSPYFTFLPFKVLSLSISAP